MALNVRETSLLFLAAGPLLSRSLVGRAASVGLAEEAMGFNGAREIQWNPWDAIVTTAFRFGRLSLDLDRTNRVTRITCG
jgi:hypothetical protein